MRGLLKKLTEKYNKRRKKSQHTSGGEQEAPSHIITPRSVQQHPDREHSAASQDVVLHPILQHVLGPTRSIPELSVLVCGMRGSGVLGFTRRMILSHYSEEFDPTGDDSNRRQIQLFGYNMICDFNSIGTPEHFEYDWIIRDISKARFYILLYNVGSRESFIHMQRLHKHILANSETIIEGRCWLSGLVVAAGAQMSGEAVKVSCAEGFQYARVSGLAFLETSTIYGEHCSGDDVRAVVRSLLLQVD